MALGLQAQLPAQTGLGLCRVRQKAISICPTAHYDFGIRLCRPAFVGAYGLRPQLQSRRHRQCRVLAMFGEDDELKEGIEKGTRIKVIKSVKVIRIADVSRCSDRISDVASLASLGI